MQGRGAIQLPEGEGKEIVQHGRAPHVIASATLPTRGIRLRKWKTTVAMMLNVGANVPKDKVDTVLNYLIKNFPEKPAPPAVTVPGNVEVSFKEWKVPTPGSRPHDPLAAPDGHNLVHGTHGQSARPHRPKDGRHQGISSHHSGLRSARPGDG